MAWSGSRHGEKGLDWWEVRWTGMQGRGWTGTRRTKRRTLALAAAEAAPPYSDVYYSSQAPCCKGESSSYFDRQPEAFIFLQGWFGNAETCIAI